MTEQQIIDELVRELKAHPPQSLDDLRAGSAWRQRRAGLRKALAAVREKRPRVAAVPNARDADLFGISTNI